MLISDTSGALPINLKTDSSPSVSPLPSSRLRLVLSPSPTPMSTILGLSSPRFQALPLGSRVEVSHAAFKVARKAGEVLGSGETSRGSALIVDYGGDQAYGNSFRVSSDLFDIGTALIWVYQAFKDHKIVDVFHRPGECDLTANVDFAYLKESLADLGAQ